MKSRVNILPAVAVIALAMIFSSCGKKDETSSSSGSKSVSPASSVSATEEPAADGEDNEGPKNGLIKPALVYTTNVQGNPYEPGASFTIDVAIDARGSYHVQAYGFRAKYDSNIVKLTAVTDLELGGSPPILGAVYGDGADAEQSLGAMGNYHNKKRQLSFCRLTFDVLKKSEKPYSITIVPDEPNVLVVNVEFNPSPYVLDNSATDPLPKP